MNATLAKVAGVKNISICTPTSNGEYNDAVLAACKIVGIKDVYRVGGAQAVASLAYGTKIIKAVNKIVGPGNKFVGGSKETGFW